MYTRPSPLTVGGVELRPSRVHSFLLLVMHCIVHCVRECLYSSKIWIALASYSAHSDVFGNLELFFFDYLHVTLIFKAHFR